jgi:hypothetical protein
MDIGSKVLISQKLFHIWNQNHLYLSGNLLTLVVAKAKTDMDEMSFPKK